MKGKFFSIIVLYFLCCLMSPLLSSAHLGRGPDDIVVHNIPDVTTFYEKKDKGICAKDGKPVIYLFSATWCSQAQWAADVFDKVMKEYIVQDKIIASHWEIDIKDNTLTDNIETAIPAEVMAVYEEYNPNGSVPTFIFGCKYYRTGKGYRSSGNLEDEEKEFRALIEYLIAELNPADTKEASLTQESNNDELGYKINNSGIVSFEWGPASGNPDYYKVLVAVDPKDPFNVQVEEFTLVATTNQPFFKFLGEKGRVYVLQTQAVRKHQYLITVYRQQRADSVLPVFYCQTQELIGDNLIRFPETKDQLIGSFIGIIEEYGSKSDPSKPVLCLMTNTDPEKAEIYIAIPAKANG